MSASVQATPRRGGASRAVPQDRRSSTVSVETTISIPNGDSRPQTGSSNTALKGPVERRCVIWVHDEQFSKEEVIFNMSLLPAGSVKPGQLMAIVALKTDTAVRDFQERTPPPKRGTDSLSASMHLDASNSDIRSTNGSVSVDGYYDVDPEKQYLFAAREMSKELKSKHPTLEISVAKHIADVFGFKHRSNILVTLASAAATTASHVELSYKDQYLSRADMWRLTLSELSNKTVYKGQKIIFMGTIKAQISAVYVAGRTVQSAFFSTNTKPIFRSESARYVIFIQMSKEMWDFDSEGSGEIMFTKVVNGFLPALFKRWVSLKAHHLVSIVMFTRVEYDAGLSTGIGEDTVENSFYTGMQDGTRKPYKDFYRVVVSEMASGEWTTILFQLKREFKMFRRDISMHRLETVVDPPNPDAEQGMGSVPGTKIEAEPTFAMHGNVLEAINLASTQFSQDHVDRDLVRTGISVIVITPGPGLFEVDYETLKSTTETLIGTGIGIDLVCLPKIPLHSVPLFRYRSPHFTAFQENLRTKTLGSESSTPRQSGTVIGSYSTLHESLSPSKASSTELNHRLGLLTPKHTPNEWNYAIPHWLDVSFWTGASQDLLSRPGARLLTKSDFFRRGLIQHPNDFAIRCKMYEIEMLGNFHSAEISVAPLPDYLQRSLLAHGSETPSDSAAVSKELRRYAGLSEPILGPSRAILDKKMSRAEREFFEIIDTFDEKAAGVTSPLKTSPSKLELRRQAKLLNEQATRRILAEDSKVFGTSFHDGDEAPKAMSLVGAALSARKKDEPQSAETKHHSRTESGGSNVSKASLISPTRPAKISRQISLGFRGFGIAAPKAAVAEIQTEHASASKVSAVGTRSTNGPSSSSTAMASHLLASPRSDKNSDRPTSSQGSIRSTKEIKEISKTLEALTADEGDKGVHSRPITIKTTIHPPEETTPVKARSMLGSLYEGADAGTENEELPLTQKLKSSDSLKASKSKLLAGAVTESSTLSPTTALSPWLNILNPSNPSIEDNVASQYKRWQHVFPRPLRTKAMKWKSLCSPAAVPLTTEYFPTKLQLDTEYQQMPYNISQNADDDLPEIPKSRGELFRELVNLRLSQSYQIVVGPAVAEAFGQKALKLANAFDADYAVEDGDSIFMSMGNIIHQLSCVNGTEVEVNVFVRKSSAPVGTISTLSPRGYYPAICTRLDKGYASRDIGLNKPRGEYNWNYVDSFISGHNDKMTENLHFWRARFVLIPVDRPSNYQRKGEDTDEEIRLEGIKHLTQMWQRYRYVPPSERGYQNLSSRKRKDPNPLDIVYQTQDPSVVVTAELETLLQAESGDTQIRRPLLLSEGERFRKTNLNISALVEAIQAPVEKGGVRMQNRRWHLRLHYNCFIGSDMTTWLLENFEDVETRQDAVELGNMLMTKDEKVKEKEPAEKIGKEQEQDKNIGIFVHVEQRHLFRDGQYFYQLAGDKSKPRPETRTGWSFAGRRRDTSSIPTTPMSDTSLRDSPKPERTKSGSDHDNKTLESSPSTPTTTGTKGPKVTLSRVMKYDLDTRKRSYRPERVNLHYDRLHNPDNCYHIRLDWMNTTPKLIEDAVESWATTAERYGLRLVGMPINEAASVPEVHPFRAPYLIELAVQPPDNQPLSYFDTNSLGPQPAASRHYYQKAIMKKHNFVLDMEAAQNFPSNVDVTYSWGRPNYRYTQYVHRSGVVLAQINNEGNILLLANKLYNNRSFTSRDYERFVKPSGDSHHGGGSIRMSSATAYSAQQSQSPVSSPMLRATIASPALRPTAATTDFMPLDPLNINLANTSQPNTPRITTPETIKDDLEAFCSSPALLEAFYRETLEKSTPPSATPPVLQPRSGMLGSMRSGMLSATSFGGTSGNSDKDGMLLESNIPTLGLPPGILSRDSSSPSPSPLRGGSGGAVGVGVGVSSMAMAMAMPVRRQSAHLSDAGTVGSAAGSGSGSGSGGGGVTDSPRGSMLSDG